MKMSLKPPALVVVIAFTGRFAQYLGTRDSSPVVTKRLNPKLFYRQRTQGRDYFDIGYNHESNGQSINTLEGFEQAKADPVFAKLPESEKFSLPDVNSTAAALDDRVRALASAIHQLDRDASPDALRRLEQRIADTRVSGGDDALRVGDDGAVVDEPPGARITDEVAEDDIEAPPDLVDEIVHIGLMAAVVVAGEEATPLAVEQDPAREVDRLDAREVAAIVDMPRTVTGEPENRRQQRKAKPVRLDAADNRILVGHVVILVIGKLGVVVARRRRNVIGLVLLVPAQHREEGDNDREHGNEP